MKILLFDVDGTLVNSGGAGRRALDAALLELYGVSDGSKGVRLAGNTDLRNFAESIRRAAGRVPKKSEILRLAETYVRLLPKAMRASIREKKYRVIPGARTFLSALGRRADVLLGLGTGNIEPGARIKLQPSGLNRHFAFGGFGSDAQHRWLMLRRAVARGKARLTAAQRRAIRPGRDVFVIGDTALDVAAGKRAGYRTVAVATGWDSEDDLEKAGPELIVKDFREGKKILALMENDDD